MTLGELVARCTLLEERAARAYRTYAARKALQCLRRAS
jgi:hypothetical protein